MRRTLARITLTAAATAGLAATTALHALGLGDIEVSSNLNQRFVASIPLTEISAEDLETVTITVAPNDAFERAGVERTDYLSTLDFEIKNDRGRPRVVVTSRQIAKEPVLDLLLQARWKGGKIVRDYTVLLDPLETIAARPVPPPPLAPAPVIARPSPAKPAMPVGSEFYEPTAAAKPIATKPVKQASVTNAGASAFYDPSFDSATGSYGPVAPKETLWSIATKVRPGPRVSMDQVLLALAEANPVAIQNGTTVSKGVTLRVPSAERIEATSAAAAKSRLIALRGGQPVSTRRMTKAPQPSASIIAKPATPVEQPVKAATPPASLGSSSSLPDLPKPQIALPPTPASVPATSANTATNSSTSTATPSPTASTPTVAPASAPAPAANGGTAAPTTAPSVEPTVAASSTVPAATPSPASTPVAGTAATSDPVAASAAPIAAGVPAPAKSPLAQPLPESEAPGFFEEYGLPLLAALVLLLLAGLGVYLTRRNKTTKPAGDYSGFKPGDTSTVTAPVGGAGALARLGDSSRMPDAQAASPRESTTGPMAAAATQQLTQPVDLKGASAQQATLILDPDAIAALNESAKATAPPSGTAGFDRTMQIQVDTLNIDLADNDPISEADFHLAYGLYDEAILLLKTATAREPQRDDLKIKLAETYFAAGRPMEFQEIAEELKGSLTAGEWSKLAIMGSQICPGVALFDSNDDGALDADFDLAFDEPSAPAPVVETAAAPQASNRVEFSLDMPKAAPVRPGAANIDLPGEFDDESPLPETAFPPAGLDDDASIDFMLGQSLTPLGAGTRVPEPADLSFNLGSPALNVDMPRIDNPKLTTGMDSSLDQRATLVPATDVVSLSLQDLEVSITPRQSSTESVEDDLNTKLDLARAYVEMGDTEMARSLLQEVQQQGGDRHQKEAASLLQRLPA